ncbi:GntR family transcriptional regulator [Pseudomonas sp. Marseille-QA0332]
MPDKLSAETKPARASQAPRATTLKQNSLSETIFQDVRARLQSGEFDDQRRLLDYEIAEEFGCTRMPVRQALLRLVSDGYLQPTTRGFVLPHYSRQDLLDIFEMRRLLEPAAAASTVPQMTDHHLSLLSRACRQARRALVNADSAMLIEAAFTFRQTWLDRVANGRLKATIEKFGDQARMVRSKTLTIVQVQEVAVEGLARILEAFEAGQPQRVEEAMGEFLRQAEQALITYTVEEPEPEVFS